VSNSVILVADDDDDILLLVTTRLRRDGHEIVQASRGDTALALAREVKPALAVLDVGMPGLDGTRVLLLTAKAQESDVRRGYESGADAYVKKPFSPTELSRRVNALLSE
jgi:DNA-binding response OmpR family regulator